MESEKDYRVTGMKFPPQVNLATGRFETVFDEESIKESIKIILLTGKKERFIRPEFGSNVLDFTFMDKSQAMLNLMFADLERDIKRNEPRVENVSVTIGDESSDEKMYIHVDYTIYGMDEGKDLTLEI